MLGKWHGKAVSWSLYLCDINHRVQRWGRVGGGFLGEWGGVKLQECNLLLLVLCSREDAVHGD